MRMALTVVVFIGSFMIVRALSVLGAGILISPDTNPATLQDIEDVTNIVSIGVPAWLSWKYWRAKEPKVVVGGEQTPSRN